MKNLFFATICLLSACTGFKYSFLENTYPPEGKTSILVDKPFDEVWDEVIDFFALNGIGITTIEKASGIVVANEFNFINAYCFEKDRKPEKGGKFIILAPVKYGEVNLKPEQVLADWNVRVRRVGDKTKVTVNLVNITAGTIRVGSTGLPHTVLFTAASTGVLESRILNFVQGISYE